MTDQVKADDMDKMNENSLKEVLLDMKQPIGNRMRAIFFLRTKNTEEAVKVLAQGLEMKGDSSLVRHEEAYCLGQMQNTIALPTLYKVLRDVDDCPVVRHESAESIASIGKQESMDILVEFSQDSHVEVSETCQIAVDRLKWLEKQRNNKETAKDPNQPGLYNSVDPAPPQDEEEQEEEKKQKTVEELVQDLLDVQKPLFKRYRAMFSLRNVGTEEAVLGLTKGLNDKSALFAHEVAFVLGQMEHPASIPALIECLENTTAHGMTRHEAAEALGAHKECVEILEKFLHDPDPLVSESCATALDTIKYWQEFEAQNDETTTEV